MDTARRADRRDRRGGRGGRPRRERAKGSDRDSLEGTDATIASDPRGRVPASLRQRVPFANLELWGPDIAYPVVELDVR